ncbi:MAG: bifunctional diaminohydroxyphosphoribosylaminopyrimidine deaminase/5-amino-6-(5-phosphoribosylamino)uracil reductase RibD, partial [Bacteroidetes bacterium]|nr:bifunctional diaminohydroxyphosphoribosylaminopyrimidine deaminase/5-amino-6-(5-phosphoribosylamino)uracil reductase RibD [Bacteroidota bacterium]
MRRCMELALRGAGFAAPNPLVGAVLVYENRVIGEGYHEQYGKAHAEVNCINSVSEKDKQLISSSTLYVSLEPCAHYGKTPPCSDLIIRHHIPEVVIGCKDPFDKVDGKGIEKLRAAGIKVIVGILEDECIGLNKRFFTFHQQHRPYIILKWA